MGQSGRSVSREGKWRRARSIRCRSGDFSEGLGPGGSRRTSGEHRTDRISVLSNEPLPILESSYLTALRTGALGARTRCAGSCNSCGTPSRMSPRASRSACDEAAWSSITGRYYRNFGMKQLSIFTNNSLTFFEH